MTRAFSADSNFLPKPWAGAQGALSLRLWRKKLEAAFEPIPPKQRNQNCQVNSYTALVFAACFMFQRLTGHLSPRK
jgi:hypothetical protein